MTTTGYYEKRIPRWLKAVGCFEQERGGARFRWGEFCPRWGLTAELCLFGDEARYSLHVLPVFGQWFINLPIRARREPRDGMESWGLSWKWGMEGGADIFLHWGTCVKIVRMPFYLKFHSSEIMRRDGSWRPRNSPSLNGTAYDSASDPLPDVFAEKYPYHYLLSDGEVQHVMATVTVERWTWRRIKWLAWPRLVRRSIDVSFDGEVGERAGSWKGGCVGCSYEMKLGEEPRHTLRRMQAERRFR